MIRTTFGHSGRHLQRKHFSSRELEINAVSRAPIEAGQILNNRYRVLDLLGKGGMGQVFLVDDLSTQSQVALKTIREGFDDADRRRFEREIRTLQTLDHPHIVPFRDLGLVGESLFYTMDYQPGATLEEVLEGRGPVTTSEELDWFLRLMLQVVDALRYLHQRRLVHRDVKPSNILVRAPVPDLPFDQYLEHPTTVASLTDFGLVKTRDGRHGMTRTALGTPQYMSPEQIEVSSGVDERSDLYSVGVVLYRIVTGQLPFQRLSEALSRTPPTPARQLNEKLPELLDQVLSRLLQFEPYRRPATADEVFELLQAVLDRRFSATSETPAVSKLSQPIFCGRNQQLELLRTMTKRTARGQGAWVSITGERGIGKSWLVSRSDFKSHSLIQTGLAVYQGNFGPAYPHSGFEQVVVSVLRHIERHQGRAQVTETLGRWGQHMRTLFPQLHSEGWLDPCPVVDADVPQEVLKERIFETVVSVLLAAAEVEPRAIVLEDVHYGDDFDLELLRRLVLNSVQLPVLLVTTHRPEFEGRLPALERLLNEMRSEERVTELELGPFQREESRHMVASMLAPARDLPDAFVDVLQERTDGVPLYLLHLLNSLWNRNMVHLDGARWEVDPEAVRALPIPESTRSHFLLALDEMDPLELKVLNIAAVLGPEFSFDVLLEALEIDEFELDAVCRNLVYAGVLEEHQDGFRFLRSFEQEIILSRLSKPMFRRLHARVGRMLESFHGSVSEEQVGDIAEHMYLGGDHERGVEYLRRAATQAEKAYAHRAALDYTRKALELCQDSSLRPALLVAQGDHHLKLGELDQAVQSFRESVGYFTQVEKLLLDRGAHLTEEQCQELLEYVQLLLKFGEVSVRRGDFEPALENFQKAEQIARRIDSTEEIAMSLVRQAASCAYTEDFDRAVEAYQSAVELYEHLPPGQGLASAWGGLAAVEKVRGNVDRAHECFQKGLQISEEIRDQLLTARLLNNLGNQYRQQGRLDEAVRAFERALDIRERFGDRQGVAVCFMNLGRAQAFLGDLTRSLEALTRAQDAFQAMGDKHGLLLSLGNLGTAHYFLGNFGRARSYFEEYLRDAQRTGVQRSVADAHQSIGILELTVGNLDDAQANLESSLETFERAGDSENIVRNQVYLARLRWRQGHLEAGLALCRDARERGKALDVQEPLAEGLQVEAEILREQGELEQAEELALRAHQSLEAQNLPYSTGNCCQTLGKIYRDLGFYYADKAGKYFEQALRLFEMLGARHALAVTQVEYGVFLGLVEETESARSLFESAQTTFESLQTQPDLQRVAQEMSELP